MSALVPACAAKPADTDVTKIELALADESPSLFASPLGFELIITTPLSPVLLERPLPFHAQAPPLI